MSAQPTRERRPLGVKNVGLDNVANDASKPFQKVAIDRAPPTQRQDEARSPTPSARPLASRSAKAGRSFVPPGPVTTPRKRAVPIEDVHCRNTVQPRGPTNKAGELLTAGGDDDHERLMSPHKRSRSSTSSQSNAKEAQPSTGDSSIARGIDGISVSAKEGSSQAATSAASFATARTPSVAQPSTSATASVHAGPSRPSASTQSGIPRPTTTRIDKMSRMSEEERAARERHRREQSEAWRRKFLKAFPSFRFHLDGLEESTKLDITRFVTTHHGSIEPFFSKQVTHLITGRKQPSASALEHAPKLPAKTSSRPANTFASVRAASKGKAPSMLPSRKRATGPQHSDRNPFEELGPPSNGNDVVAKAQQLGIKVWTLEKFHTVVQQLYGERLPERGGAGKPDLKQLLRAEKLHGTLERDPMTKRGDYHYFDRRNCWLLVEDATQEHQVIHAQEYKRPGHDEEPPWPRIYGELEGRCPFTRYELDSNYRRRFKPNRFETLRRITPAHHGRAASLSPGPVAEADILRAPLPRGASPYALASGNSVSVASHITSTTSAAVGSSLTGQASILLDKRLSHLGRRTADIGPSRLGPGNGVTRSASMGNNSMAAAAATAVKKNAAAAAAAAQEQPRGAIVRKMLGLNDQVGTGFRRSASTPAIAQHEIPREKKPGYCENCRAKYDDFDEHIASRKHVKFANNDAHFVDIDQLLLRVVRPRLPYYGDSTFGGTSYDGDEDRSEPGFPGYDEGSIGGSDVSGFATDVAPQTSYEDDEEVLSAAATLAGVGETHEDDGDDDEMAAVEEGEDEQGEDEDDLDRSYSEYIDDGMAGDETGGETVDTAHTSPHTSPDASRQRLKEMKAEGISRGEVFRRDKSPHPQRWAASRST